MRLHELTSAYYFAYGHLTQSKHLHDLAPGAKFVGTGVLDNFRLDFHRFANIRSSHGDQVHGVVWKVTRGDFVALDNHEALHENYDKIQLEIKVGEKYIDCMTYIMDPANELKGPPPEKYIQAIIKGYREHDLPMEQIKQGLEDF